MYDKIYLHVGLPKAGSSYLQSALDRLSRKNALIHTSYPVLEESDEFIRIQSGNGVFIAGQLFEENAPEFSPEAVSRHVRQLLDAADASKPNLLISSEFFSQAVPQRMAHLLELLRSHARTVEILVFVRPFDLLCWSGYHQKVKRRSLSDEFDETFFEDYGEKTIKQISMIGNLPNPVHILDYRRHGLLGVLMEALAENSRLEFDFEEQTVNRSLTGPELRLLRTINAVFRDNGLAKRISDRWIYASPEAVSDKQEFDRTPILDAFRRLVASNSDRLASETCRALIRRLVPDDRTASVGHAAAGQHLALDGPQDAGADSADLLRMALEEIAKLSKPDQDIRRYTQSLTPTREAFDPVHYLLLNRDVLAAGVDPVTHYRQSGRRKGRYSAYSTVSALFD